MNNPCMSIMIAATLLAVACPAAPVQKRGVRQMELREFLERMSASTGFEVTVEGAQRKSFFTGKSYVHYETVAYIGQQDIRSTWRNLYHTEHEFTLRHGDVAVTLDFRRIRTSLAPARETTYTKKTIGMPKTDPEQSIMAMLDEEKLPAVLIVEFGLEAGKKYYARVRTESYHLPPEGPDGRPRRRENRVLLISDRPINGEIRLTPLYQNWSY